MKREALLLIATLGLLLGACSAEFKSGVTACGAREPRCPSGYTCVNNVRCVKMDGTDVVRTDGGPSPAHDAALGPPPQQDARVADATVYMDAVAPPPPMVDAGPVSVDMASNVDAMVVPAGQAVVKFCNPIRRVDGNPTEMELVIGNVRLKASTRQCAPAFEMPCSGVPAGAVTLKMLREGTELVSMPFTLDQSGQYLFSAKYDGTYSIETQKLAVGQNCPGFDFPPVSYVKFCNQLIVREMGMVKDVTLDLAIGTGMEKVTATSGACNTMDNLACYYTRSGNLKLSLQDMGSEITSVMANLMPNGNYGILANVDPATRQPRIQVVPIPAGTACAAYKPPAPPPPVVDGGAGDARTGG